MSADVEAHIDEWVVDEAVKESLTCSICLDILLQPVNLSTCPHTFCLRCLHDHISHPEPTCPQCAIPLSPNLSSLLSTNECINGFINEQLRKVRVACPHCHEWTGILGVNRANVIAHHAECGEVLLLCAVGCGLSIPRNEIAVHESDECPQRLVRCERCNEPVPLESIPQHHINDLECDNCHFCTHDCGELVLDSGKTTHDTYCGYFPLLCDVGCDQLIQRSELRVHESDECPRRLVECERCNEELPFEVLAEHHINDRECENCHLCDQGCGGLVLDVDAAEHNQHNCSHRSVDCPMCEEELQHHQLEAHLQTNFIHHFTTLCSNRTSLRQQLSEMSDLQRTMQSEINTLREQVSRTASSFTSESAAIEWIGSKGTSSCDAVADVVSLMRSHPKSSGVQLSACHAVLTLRQPPQNYRQTFVDGGWSPVHCVGHAAAHVVAGRTGDGMRGTG